MKAWLWFVLFVCVCLLALFAVPPMLSAQDTATVIAGILLLASLAVLGAKVASRMIDSVDW